MGRGTGGMSSEGTEVADIQDRFLFSLSQLSTAFGPSRETVNKRLMAAGVAARSQRRNHNVYHIGDAALAILSNNVPTFEGVSDPDQLSPKDRLDWFKSETERLKLEEKQGAVLVVEVVRVEWGEMLQKVGAALDAIPDKLEQKCRLGPDELQEVENVIDSARVELAEQLEK